MYRLIARSKQSRSSAGSGVYTRQFPGNLSMVITMRPCVRCRRRNGFGWHGHDHVSGMVMTIDWGLCLYGYDHDVGMVMIMGVTL